MSKLATIYPNDDVVVCQMQALHIVSLYGEYIFPKVAEESLKPDDPMDPLNLVRGTSLWAAEQVLRVGLITLYHQWERATAQLLNQQSARWRIEIKTRARGQTVNSWVQAVLADSFEVSIPPEIWKALEEMRRLVNLLKHADMTSFSDFAANYPGYFSFHSPPLVEIDFEISLFVSQERFNALATAAIEFWSELPYVTKYSAT